MFSMFCLRADNQTHWIHENATFSSLSSSIVIRAGAFQANRSYELMVKLTRRTNSSDTANGSVVIEVRENISQSITVGLDH